MAKGKKNAKSIVVPSTVKISGKNYKVTTIAKNAFAAELSVPGAALGSALGEAEGAAVAEGAGVALFEGT